MAATQQKSTPAEPKKTSSRYIVSEEIFNALPEHIAVLDANGLIVLVNNSWISFHEEYLQTGLHTTEVVGKHYLDFYKSICDASDKNGLNITQGIQSVLKKEIISCKTEYRISITPARWFLFTVKTLNESDRVIIVESDISESKEAEQMRDEFVSIASHELKTPITTLKGIAHILQLSYSKKLKGEFNKLVSTMDQQLNKLNKIIGDLVVINTPKNRSVKLYVDKFDFKILVKESVQAVKNISQMHFIEIKNNDSVHIMGDRFRLEQVMTNMLTNAVKYSPQANRIIVSSVIESNNVVFSVQDFGNGIEKEKISQIFDRYYRIKKGEMTSGLGLGMYIAAEIIKAHHGKIWLESEHGKGSIFYFSLPLFNVIENI
ncbi:hypothetical protein BH20BAC1_BH20BAC1_26290 [soil metagenome]